MKTEQQLILENQVIIMEALRSLLGYNGLHGMAYSALRTKIDETDKCIRELESQIDQSK